MGFTIHTSTKNHVQVLIVNPILTETSACVFAFNNNSGRIWIENNNLVHFFAIRKKNFQ